MTAFIKKRCTELEDALHTAAAPEGLSYVLRGMRAECRRRHVRLRTQTALPEQSVSFRREHTFRSCTDLSYSPGRQRQNFRSGEYFPGDPVHCTGKERISYLFSKYACSGSVRCPAGRLFRILLLLSAALSARFCLTAYFAGVMAAFSILTAT